MDPSIWESSRFALDIASSAPTGAGGTAIGTYELFAGMIEFGLSRRLSRIVTATDLRMERILRRAGLPLERIGEPQTIGVTRALAGYLEVSKDCTFCGETAALSVRWYGRRCFAASHDLSMPRGRAG
ncbi:acyl-homoserine-lactone synthase [Mesorhizobium sp. M0913]|uniref:acyl-homoserine-lactone synthase n=1 Tax=Mesorhizobium sp. M0913 TaxID=2957026 RepID=UPI003337039E